MSNLTLVQKTLETVLHDQNPRITSDDLYTKVKGQLDETLSSPVYFKQALGKWFKEGALVGFESRLGRTGGIYRVGVGNMRATPKTEENQVKTAPKAVVETVSEDNSPAAMNEDVSSSLVEDAEEEKEEEEKESFDGAIMLPLGLRIIKSGRNWTIQKLSGELWQGKYYYPTAAQALRGAARIIMNKEMSVKMVESMHLDNLEKFAALLDKVQKGFEEKMAESFAVERLNKEV
jgi:hypothetical protein